MSHKLKWLAGVALLALAVWCISANLNSAQDKQDLPIELGYISPDAFGFVHVRFTELLNSDLAKYVRRQFPKESAFIDELEIGNTESATLVFSGDDVVKFLDQNRFHFPAPDDFDRPRRPPFKEDFRFPPKDKFDFKEKFEEKKFETKKETFKKDVKTEEKKPFDEKKTFEEKKSFDEKKEEKKSCDDQQDEKKDDEPKKEPNFSDREVPGVLAIITLVKLEDRAKVIEKCAGKEAEEVKYKGKSIFVAPVTPNFALSFLGERTLLVGPIELQKKLYDRPPQTQPQGPHAAALKLALARHQVVVGLNLTDPKVQLGLRDLTTPRDDDFRQEPWWLVAPFASMKSMSLSLDLNENYQVQVRGALTFANPEKAVAGMDAVQDVFALTRILGLGKISHELRRKLDDADNPADLMYFHMLVKQLETTLRNTTVGRNQSTVLVQAQGHFDFDALRTQAKVEAKKLVPDEALLLLRARKQAINNLKQVMLSFHSANDVYRQMPPAAICSKKDGTPLLSWRVALLPFIEEDALYRQFKLDEPWDSEHNIKLLPRIPKVYAAVGVKTKEPYSTFLQVFTGPDTPFDLKPDDKAFFGAVGPAIPRTFIDGTSNTIGVVEAFDAVPWSKPADLPYDAKKPLPKLGGLNNGGFHVGLMDGSVRFFAGVADKEGANPLALPKGFITQETLRLAINPRDGMPLGPDW